MHQQRKLDHLRICLEKGPQFSKLTTGFEEYHFVHQALPEIDLADVDTACELLGKKLSAPLVISCMTGGTQEAERVNLSLAEAAQRLGLAMGVGSLRVALEDPSLAYTYQVRRVAPSILLLANLGAVQLNYGYSPEDCQRAVEIIEADALVLHLNPLQECLQQGGNTNFRSLSERIEEVCSRLPVPVVVKEVGWGISAKVARQLQSVGVAGIDVAGAGGTSWSAVEQERATDQSSHRLAETFAAWGIPTAESIVMVLAAAPEVVVIGSGGIRTGIDVAKAMGLGAHAAGIATPLLAPATIGADAVASSLQEIIDELRTAMFCLGLRSLEELRNTALLQRVGGE